MLIIEVKSSFVCSEMSKYYDNDIFSCLYLFYKFHLSISLSKMTYFRPERYKILKIL